MHPKDVQYHRVFNLKVIFREKTFIVDEALLNKGPEWVSLDENNKRTMPPQTVLSTHFHPIQLIERIERYLLFEKHNCFEEGIYCDIQLSDGALPLQMKQAAITKWEETRLQVIGTLEENGKVYDIFNPVFKPIKASPLPSYIRFEDLLEEED